MIKYFYLTVLLTFLCGCERDLNLEKYRNPEIENMLVVNSIINPDSLIGVSVTYPHFLTDSYLSFSPVSSLDVRIAGDDNIWEPLYFNPECRKYIANRKPREGEVLRLQVNGEGKDVLSCDTVPYKIEIEGITASGEGPMHIFWDNDYRFTYKITFQDPANEDNYYFLSIDDIIIPGELPFEGQYDYTIDYVFQVLANMINQDTQGWKPNEVFGYPFCDKGIDGQRYTLTVSEVIQNPPPLHMIKTLPREIKLYSISKAYFDYMISVLSMDYNNTALKGNLLSLGLIEPTKIYSNIDGGTGLMGCYNLCSRKVNLLELTGGWPSSGH